jgi:F0F1-type ATP synthase membrane subunit b/b'
MMIFQFIVLQVVVFGAVIYFLKKILYGNTESAINRLGGAYEDLLQKQQDLVQKIEAGEKELEQNKLDAQTAIDKIKAESLDDIRNKEDAILKKARGEAEQIIANANAAKEEMYQEMESMFSRKAADVAVRLIPKVLSPEMLKHIHKEMVAVFLGKVRNFDFTRVDIAADQIVIRTAFPLEGEEKSKIESILASKFNKSVAFKEFTDQELFSGIVFQFGTLRLDGSLANALAEASEDLKKRG